MREFPFRLNSESVKAAVVDPKVLCHGRPWSKRDAAIDCDIVKEEVPQKRANDENGGGDPDADFDPLRFHSR